MEETLRMLRSSPLPSSASSSDTWKWDDFSIGSELIPG